MISKKILNYLEKNKIKYEIVPHKTVYTAYDLAQTLKKKMSEIAKTVIIKADKDYFLAVIPADRQIDFKKVKKILKAKKVTLAPERIMKSYFKVKLGAITSFGQLHKCSVIMDKNLLKTKKALFSGGDFNNSLLLSTKAFVKLENPIIALFTTKKKIKKK